MTEEQQRIAIAEACGWTKPTDCTRNPPHNWRNPQDGCCYDPLPDYLNDLNAIHGAEKTLTEDQQVDYAHHLKELAAPITGEDWMAIHATAAARAEAFLRTLNLWTE